MAQVANVVWNKINPWSNCDQDLAILDPYTVYQLLLEMECNTEDHSQGSIKQQAIASIQSKLETALEIVKDLAPILEIYLAEEASPYNETPNLYCQDYNGIYSMHLKRWPIQNGSLVMSYRSYVVHTDSLNPDSKIPQWKDLQDYFVSGIYID